MISASPCSLLGRLLVFGNNFFPDDALGTVELACLHRTWLARLDCHSTSRLVSGSFAFALRVSALPLDAFHEQRRNSFNQDLRRHTLNDLDFTGRGSSAPYQFPSLISLRFVYLHLERAAVAIQSQS